MKAHSTSINAPILFGSCLVGIAATILLIAFTQVLGFSIPLLWLILLASSATVGFLLLPEYWPHFRPRLAYFCEKYPLYVLLLVGTVSRVIFGVWTGLFPDEYTVLDLLRRIPVSDLGGFLSHYTDFAGTLAGHPPLSFLIMLGAYVIYPGELSIRLMSTIFSVASVILVYGIVTELGKKKEAFLAALFYAIVPHSLMFMDLALTDVYMNFFGLLGIWLIIRSLRMANSYLAVMSGVALGLSLWSKAGLPLLWAALLLTVVLGFRGKTRTLFERLGYLALAASVAGLIFGLWWIINPKAFYLSNSALLRLLIISLNPSAYQWFSKNIPLATCVSPGSEVNNFSSFLTEVFPKLCKGGLSFISYPELLVQIPFWITPIILLLSLAGIIFSLRRIPRIVRRAPADLIMLAWVSLPLLAMIPLVRDIRYILVFTPAAAYFAARGIGIAPRNIQRRMLGLALTFALIFNGVAFVIGQQQYYGPPQAVQRLEILGLDKGPILTNWVALKFELPATDVREVNDLNSTGVHNQILTTGIKVVVFFYNARGSPESPSPQIRSAVKALFTLYYKEGPSQFAWFEIFYKAKFNPSQPSSQNTYSQMRPDANFAIAIAVDRSTSSQSSQ